MRLCVFAFIIQQISRERRPVSWYNPHCYSPEHEKMAAATSYLLSRRLPDGRWPLDREATRPPFSFGQAGAANKWLTLDALRVLKLAELVADNISGAKSKGPLMSAIPRDDLVSLLRR